MPSARRTWLSQLKEDAVRQLPSTASPAVRARLRLDVENALRLHGPDDPALELQDILSTLIAEARSQLTEIEHQARRAERKRALMSFAQWALTATINECPTYLVGSLGSDKRTHTTRAAWADLRPILDKTLSGTESKEDVQQRVEEYVAQWRREHDRWWRPRLPSPDRVVKGIRTAKVVVDAVNNTPELRLLVDTAVQVVQATLRQRRQPKEPPSSPS